MSSDNDNSPTTDDEHEVVEWAPTLWKQFEQDVAQTLVSMEPGATIEHDVHLKGLRSGRQRQVDVLVTGVMAGLEMRIAVECKHYKRPLGIGKVDEFVGKLLDLDVDAGILYTVNGADAGATARAKHASHPNVELRVLTPSGTHGEDWEAVMRRFRGFGDCPNENCYTGDLGWQDWSTEDGTPLRAGSCDTCGTWGVECPDCGEITGMHWSEQSCDSCSNVFTLVYDRKGSDVEAVALSREAEIS